MVAKNITVKLSDTEIQKVFSLTIHGYYNYLKKCFRHLYIAMFLAIFNVVAYSYVSSVVGIINKPLTIFNWIFLILCTGVCVYMHKRYEQDFAMIESFDRNPVKDVKRDLSDYIKLFGNWKDADFLRTIEYVLRKGESAEIHILNESYYHIVDDDCTRMIQFDEAVIENNYINLNAWGERVDILITYDGVKVVGNGPD